MRQNLPFQGIFNLLFSNTKADNHLFFSLPSFSLNIFSLTHLESDKEIPKWGSLVKGVIIHELLLIQDHATASFLCKLLHSNLHIGISYSPSLPDNKVGVLQKMAMQYYSNCFPLNDESAIDGFNKITLSWGDNGGKIYILFLTARSMLLVNYCNLGWIIVISDVEGCWCM
ncbi:hypothetical protein OIU85_008147 [Salix viminalis]|uniref:Uncharacterized protein n=1 Tax=Salix viminalis TaxID=40686 RepID=A0A9Q0NX44_SALVM|nr:hypothetical protein OIU85_008147 [Salix viminalis]